MTTEEPEQPADLPPGLALVEELKDRLDATEDPWARLRRFIESQTEITIGIGKSPAKDDTGKPRTLYVFSAEFGREAPDSPMAGGAVYGASDTLDAALHEALEEAGA